MKPPVARFVFPILRRRAVALSLAAAALAAPAVSAVTIDWVTVGSPGNAADDYYLNCGLSNDSPCGAVAAPYEIGKYEVTNAQYTEFLNSVAADDTNGLYSTDMDSDATFGGITRSGIPGSYSYAAKAGFENMPVTYVSFWDAARFSNWLQNGQPTGAQTVLTTEDGAYTLTPAAIAANSVLRNPTASVFLPSEDEWYKAAYYDPIAELYYDYPTGTNTTIDCAAPEVDTGNSANCYPYADPTGTLTDVGAYALSDSPSGTFDQGGNVYEWHEQIKFDTDRGLRGGAWSGDWSNLDASNSDYDSPTLEIDNIGFRLASVPEPSAGSAGLLALGGLGGLALRSRRRGKPLLLGLSNRDWE